MSLINKNVTLHLSIARSCFVQCHGCYNHFSNNPQLISDDAVLDFLAQARNHDIKKVTVCGGDPLSRPKIIELLKSIKQLDFFITVDTLGVPLLRDEKTIFHGRHLVKQIDARDLTMHTDLIGIPLDGPSDEIISMFRKGRSDIFKDQLATIDVLDQCNANICINTVVCKTNYKSIIDLIPFIKKPKNIKLWQFFQFMPIGPLGFKNRDRYMIEDSEFNKFKSAMTQAAIKNDLAIRLEFKKASDRKGTYLLIDSNGDAWSPDYLNFDDKISKNLCSTNRRTIIGNIKNKKDWTNIIDAVFKLSHTQKLILETPLE